MASGFHPVVVIASVVSGGVAASVAVFDKRMHVPFESLALLSLPHATHDPHDDSCGVRLMRVDVASDSMALASLLWLWSRKRWSAAREWILWRFSACARRSVDSLRLR